MTTYEMPGALHITSLQLHHRNPQTPQFPHRPAHATTVGYQQQSFGRDFNYVCPTFVNVNPDKDITLGDIDASDDFYASKIEFLTPDGANDTIEIAGLGTVMKSFCFWWAEDAAAGVRGWYATEDANAEYPMNDLVIGLGSGYCVTLAGGEEEAFLTYAGQVNGEDITLSFHRDFNYVGNCTPVDITLGDIDASDDFYASKIEFLTPDGANDTIDIEGLGTVTKSFCFWWAEDAAAGVRGWYATEDSDGSYPMNDLAIKAGAAFCVTLAGGEEEATITIPTAL